MSGGVDSTVAFSLCAKALGRERVLGLYVDTGFMREGDAEDLAAGTRAAFCDWTLRLAHQAPVVVAIEGLHEADVATCQMLEDLLELAAVGLTEQEARDQGIEHEAVVEELSRDGHRQVLVAPIGFLCDHVETLYDIDIELKQFAAGQGLQLERIAMLNSL